MTRVEEGRIGDKIEVHGEVMVFQKKTKTVSGRGSWIEYVSGRKKQLLSKFINK